MKLKDRPNINTVRSEVTLKFDREDLLEIMKLFATLEPDVDYDIKIDKKRAKRSLNANAYHWSLVEQMARILHISKYEVHNQLMIDYGVDWRDQSGKRTFVLMKDDDSYMRLQTTHYRPTDATEDRKGTIYRWFVLLKPSHLMDTKEMAALIDGTVADAQELEIDTRTPDEIERMKQLWQSTAAY